MIRTAILAAVMALALAAAARAQDASFTLVNRAPVAVRELFATPAGDANWGQNRLRGTSVPPGGRFIVRRPRDGNCIMDIRAVFADGHAEVRRSLNTCNVDAVAVGLPGTAPGEAALHLINRGAQPIVAFYAVPAGGGEGWGENRLAAGPLPPATEKKLRIPLGGTCRFNLRVVFADHTAKERHGADLCRITDLPVP